MALPFARNALYPFAARSATVRLALRRAFRLGEGLDAALVCEQVFNTSAAGDDLADEAFPDPTAWGASLTWTLPREAALTLSARDDGAAGHRRLQLALDLPWGEGRGLTLGVMRALGDAADRLFATRAALAVTFVLSPPPADAPDASPEEES